MAGEATRFKPGQSGNPGGRPRGLMARAREHGDRALEVLVDAMEDDDVDVRMDAAKAILDRGFGKPVALKADVTNHLENWSDDDLDHAIDALRSSLGARPDPTSSTRFLSEEIIMIPARTIKQRLDSLESKVQLGGKTRLYVVHSDGATLEQVCEFLSEKGVAPRSADQIIHRVFIDAVEGMAVPAPSIPTIEMAGGLTGQVLH